jgi:hypothetical protein
MSATNWNAGFVDDNQLYFQPPPVKQSYGLPSWFIGIAIVVALFIVVSLLPIEDVVYTYVQIPRNKLLDTAVKAFSMGVAVYTLRAQITITSN